MNELPDIPGYEMKELLGEGGMASVYLGIQKNLKRKVAVKVLDPVLLRDKSFAERFLKEAETAASLNHPNIVTVFDVGKSGNNYYIVMEYLDDSLKDRISASNGRGLNPGEVLRIVAEVARALQYAHSAGYIHRDIKPDNILFRKDGTPVLADFGIARAIDSTTKLTKTGTSIGTPHYMSPEQIRGQDTDHRSDIYSLGIIFYEMLIGHVPFDATDTIAIAMKHVNEPIPDLPVELNVYQPLLRLMAAKEPAERPRNCLELLQLVNQPELLNKRRQTPPQVPVPRAHKRRRSAKGPILAVLVSLLVILSLAVFYIIQQEGRQTLKNVISDKGQLDPVKKVDPGAFPKQPEEAVADSLRRGLAEVEDLVDRGEFERALARLTTLKKIATSARVRELEAELNGIISRIQTDREKRKEDAKKIISSQVLTDVQKELESGLQRHFRVNLRSSYSRVHRHEFMTSLELMGIFSENRDGIAGFRNEFEAAVIEGEDVVFDHATSLMWELSGSPSFNFKMVQVWISDFNSERYAGFNDWRLPTVEEAASLLTKTKNEEDLYIDPIFSGFLKSIWTGDSLDDSQNWTVDFSRRMISPQTTGTRTYGSNMLLVRKAPGKGQGLNKQ